MNEEIDDLKPLLTVRQVAKILHLSEYSVRRYLKESKIKGSKLRRARQKSLKDCFIGES
jgi:predicted transcriptional regulator